MERNERGYACFLRTHNNSNNRMNKTTVDSYIIISIFVLFYWIPASIQVPFRVLILFLINLYVFGRCKNKILYLCPFIVVSYFILYKIECGSFDNSLLMVLFSVSPVLCFSIIGDRLFVKKRIIYICCIIAIIGAIIQLCIFRYNGRPTLSYEINHSGSFIFLLFLYCDYIGYKVGRVIVAFFSLLLLSRLCILCILLVYFIRFAKNIFLKQSFNFSYFLVIIMFGIATSVFSIWYTLNMKDSITATTNDSDRLKGVNDGSNYYRFMINSRILFDIYDGNKIMIYEGYGDLAKEDDYSTSFGSQPHNELIKHTAQYGLLFTIFLLLISSRYYSKLTCYNNLEYILPIFVYTQILWVRFTIVPSLEMLFIFYLLTLKLNKRPT